MDRAWPLRAQSNPSDPTPSVVVLTGSPSLKLKWEEPVHVLTWCLYALHGRAE